MGFNLGSLFGSAAGGAAGGAAAGPVGAIGGAALGVANNLTAGIGAKSKAEAANSSKQQAVINAIQSQQQSKANIEKYAIIGIIVFIVLVAGAITFVALRKK